MIRRFVKSGVAVVVAFSMILMPGTFTQAKAATTNYEEVVKLADTKAQALTSIYGVTSVQYALIDDGNIVVSGQSGVYSKESTTPLTKEHMYGIGSVSKIFTTAAVMKLTEQGKLNLDSPVVNYLTEFKMADERYKDITLRMLLNHSSGLMGGTLSDAMLLDDNDTVSMDTLLDELKTQRLKADPGAYSTYCNDGFSLAQLIVEKVSGMGFSEFIKKNFSDPLSMANTKTPLDDFKRDQLVKTYLDGSYAALPVESLNAIGAGGIYSSAEDMCRFAQIFMYDTNDQILSDASAKAMANSEYLSGMWYPDEDSIISYGLGWDSVNTYPFTQYGIKALVKGGDTQVYHSSLIVLPEEGMAMAVLLSGGSSVYAQAMAQEVLLKQLLVTGSITQIKADKTFAVPVKADMPESEKKNAGYYAYFGGVIKVDISDDGALTLYSNTTPQQFVYTGNGKFYNNDGSTYISFDVNGGNIYLYSQSYGTLPYLGQIAIASYQAEKIRDNKLSSKVEAAWKSRADKRYFMVNEKYSSLLYPLSTVVVKVTLTEGLEGYFQNAKIIDANNAKVMLQIPGTYGRDLRDYNFYMENKTEYMEANGYLFVSQEAVKTLSSKASFDVKIASDGYAKWYQIGSKSSAKHIDVTIPDKASYTVYDSDGNLIFNSWIAGKSSTTLPAKGYIVFAGDAGAKFTVKYVK